MKLKVNVLAIQTSEGATIRKSDVCIITTIAKNYQLLVNL